MIEALKAANPALKAGFVGAKVAVEPHASLTQLRRSSISSPATNSTSPSGKSPRDGTGTASPDCPIAIPPARSGTMRHAPSCENMDELPFVTPVYKRDLTIENYFIGYLKHPYLSLYTGRGCKSRCTFCLWPQTVGGHRYRTRSVGNVIDEIRWAKAAFPQVQGVLLRRRHLHGRPAAHRGDRARAGQARRHLVVQRQGQRAARDAESDARQRPAAPAGRLRKPATSRSFTTSERACASTSRAASPGIATSSASPSTAPSSSDCPARAAKPSRKPFGSPPRSIRTPSRSRSPRPIRGRSCTARRLRHGWLDEDHAELVDASGVQIAPLHYPHLTPFRDFPLGRGFLSALLLPCPQDRVDRLRNGAEPADDGAPAARRRRVLFASCASAAQPVH